MQTLLTALAAAGLAAATAAQTPFTVLDQQPAGGSGSVADLDSPTYIADGFTITRCAGAELTQIEIWGGWAPAAPASPTFTIRVHDATSMFGQQVPLNPPRTVFTGVAPTTDVATGGSLRGYDLVARTWGALNEQRMVFVLPQPVSLPAAEFWISLASDGDPSATFSWEPGNPDPSGTSSPYANYTQPNGSWSPPTVFATRDLALVVTAVPNGPSLCVDSLTAGATGVASILDASMNGPIILGLSFGGAGPIPSPFGNVLLTPPVDTLPLVITDGTGAGSLNLPVPPGFSGTSVWFHGLDVLGTELTNGVAITIG